MSSLPSLSTSKTPAASKTLRALMSCFFQRGSSPGEAEAIEAARAMAAIAVIIRGIGRFSLGLASVDGSFLVLFVVFLVILMDLPAEGGGGRFDGPGGGLGIVGM